MNYKKEQVKNSMLYIGKYIIIIGVFIALIVYISFLISEANKNTLTQIDLYKVRYVHTIENDTIVVNNDVEDITVHLIGINTPDNYEDYNNSNYTENLLTNYTILYLEFDKNFKDKYGRTLAYVWLSPDTDNIENMLNYKLLKDKVATATFFVSVHDNQKYYDTFRQI